MSKKSSTFLYLLFVYFYKFLVMKSFKIFITLLLTLFVLGSCKSNKIDTPDLRQYTKVKDEIKTTTNTVKQIQKKPEISAVQKKYASILGVSPSSKIVENKKLYDFIDSWMGTRYKMGGENRSGIDCSFFTQFLYHDVYNTLIERTAEKQYSSPSTNKFLGQEYLIQGDLIFFNLSGSQNDIISHVGCYLGNGKFVHSTSRKAENGINGVQISNLNNKRWQKLYVAAGRKSK